MLRLICYLLTHAKHTKDGSLRSITEANIYLQLVSEQPSDELGLAGPQRPCSELLWRTPCESCQLSLAYYPFFLKSICSERNLSTF